MKRRKALLSEKELLVRDKVRTASKRASETCEQTLHRQGQNRTHMISMNTYHLACAEGSSNGPCFSSEEFTLFLKNNGILHLMLAPYHPSSNGLAKRAVQTFKQGMKKFTNGDLRDWLSRSLAHYRTTLHTTTGGVCPAELLLGRRPHTRLDLLRPSVSTRVNHKQLQQKWKC